MKNVKFNIIYVIGTMISLLGIFFYYISKNVYLSSDMLYPVSEIISLPLIIVFLVGGMVVIAFELFITKDYLLVKKQIINSLEYKVSYVAISAFIVYIISLLLDGFYGVGIIYLYVLGAIIFVIVKSKKLPYLLLSLFYILMLIDGTISSSYIDKIKIVLIIILFGTLGFGLGMIGRYIYQRIIKKKITNLTIIIDYWGMILLGVFFELTTSMSGTGDVWRVNKNTLFPLASGLLLVYVVMMLSRNFNLHQRVSSDQIKF